MYVSFFFFFFKMNLLWESFEVGASLVKYQKQTWTATRLAKWFVVRKQTQLMGQRANYPN